MLGTLWVTRYIRKAVIILLEGELRRDKWRLLTFLVHLVTVYEVVRAHFRLLLTDRVFLGITLEQHLNW